MSEIDNIGIIAGQGNLPKEVYQACKESGIKTTYIALKDIADFLPEGESHVATIKLTAIGKIINHLKDKYINNVIFVGSLKRPSLSSLIPDFEGAKLLVRLQRLRKAGDDALFQEIFKFMHEQGFNILGVKDVAPNLIVERGLLNSHKITHNEVNDINWGFHIAKKIGELDIGQSISVQEGAVLAVEAIDGTDALIKKTKELHFKGNGGILVKIKKPQQSDKIDLPTIGKETIIKLKENGFAGVAIEAGDSIILDRAETLKLADKNNIFVYGL